MFTRMDQSTKEEWDHIYNEHLPHVFDMPNRIISMLEQLDGVSLGFGTDQLHHALQTATMARRANASEEMILISLIHDIGKVINVPNHGQICAEIIKPYTVISLPHISQIHVFYLAKLLSDSFGPTNESSEVKLVEISEIPWDELAFPTVSMTLKYFVEDSKKDNFEFREEEILLS